jgi:hypothetical protein
MAIQYGKSEGGGRLHLAHGRVRRREFSSWEMPSSKFPAHAPGFTDEQEPSTPRGSGAQSADLAGDSRQTKVLSPVELHALYAGTTVPPHRYLAPALIEALHSPSIALDPAKWFTGIEDVELSAVTGAWLRTNSDTSFEQLKSVGLDPQSSQLTVALTIKQGRGYAGGPSTAGSREYVAFWVDAGSGFHYQGTSWTVVHDCEHLPVGGHELRLCLPIDLSAHVKARNLSVTTIWVRAVLSWNSPPSITHPFAQVVWGNSLDRRIVIASQPVDHTRGETHFPSSTRRSDSATRLKAISAEDRNLLFPRQSSGPVDWSSAARPS